MDRVISPSQGGSSTGVRRTRKVGPSCATGKAQPFTRRAIRTSAEWPAFSAVGGFMSNRPELLRRAQAYCEKNGLLLGSPLGSGVHGSVFAVESQTEKGKSAIKVHERAPDYAHERDVY